MMVESSTWASTCHADKEEDPVGGFTFVVVDVGDPKAGKPPTIRVHDKVKQVCRSSLYLFSIHGRFRQKVILLVDWWWFDKFILFLIMLNSILLANVRYREDEDVGYNWFFSNVADPIFTVCFTVEFLLKVVAFGLIVDERSYLRDPWNCLDALVVISALIAFLPGMSSNLGFLRVFRILRPLRGISAVPQIKVLVRTMINCLPKLGSVVVMGVFFFGVFSIVGMMLFNGVFYRRCRTIATPELVHVNGSSGELCWSWPYASGEGRLCGGRYACEGSGGFCGGHDFDWNKALRPRFPGGGMGDAQWCANSAPKKLFLSSDFIHFDHFGGAWMTIFQCMTLEGWTDVMYNVMDAHPNLALVVVYFLSLVAVTSFFLMNVTLAAIDSVFADEQEKEKEKGNFFKAMTTMTLGDLGVEVRQRCGCYAWLRRAFSSGESRSSVHEDEGGEGEFWLDLAVVRLVHRVAFSEPFSIMVMFLITANVVVMSLEKFPPQIFWLDFLDVCDKTFLWAFTVEMVVMLVAMGPVRYATTWLYLFDGAIVVISWTEVFVGVTPFSRAFRTMRVVLKLNKLARNWPKFDGMLKAMWATAKALKFWLVLFVLALYIATLMGMTCFANLFHFDDSGQAIAPGAHWCPGTEGEPASRRQDCIPRAHFDTFLWAFVTVFQVFTGENWNAIMYDGMNGGGWLFAGYFVWLILFGQVLVLSLFLTVLMAQFNHAREKMDALEAVRKEKSVKKKKQGWQKVVLPDRLKRWSGDVKAAVMTTKTLNQNIGRHPSNANAELAWVPEQDHHAPIRISTIVVRPKDAEEEDAVPRLPGLAMESPRFLSPRGTTSDQAIIPVGAQSSENDPRSTRSSSEPPFRQKRRLSSFTRRPGDPRPGSELVAATFLEALGAQISSQQLPTDSTEPEADGIASSGMASSATGSGNQATVDHSSDQPQLSDNWCSCCPCCRSVLQSLMRQRAQLRKGFRKLLKYQVRIKGEKVKVFESAIFVCIMLSTVTAMLSSPLSDPDDASTVALGIADSVFSAIFTVEIVVKFVALGPYEFFAGPDRTWNCLDTVVVAGSIMDLSGLRSGGAFKILRIIRAVRPLRIISRAPTLKVVLQTVMASLPGLVTLILVSIACTVVFALLFLSLFNGRMFHCKNENNTPVALSRDVGLNFTTPLCLASTLGSNSTQWTSATVSCPNGAFEQTSKDWRGHPSCASGPCGQARTLAWRRSTADTPICVGRCNPFETADAQPLGRQRLCPRRFELVEELPSVCPAGAQRVLPQGRLQQEAVGQSFVSAMQREFVMPCGGSVAGGSDPATAVSCRAAFCPEGASAEQEASCRSDCARHPFFCKGTCRGDGVGSAECRSCREECEAACLCSDFCEPLVQDAALCVEQGLQWTHSLSQNFDNFANAMLTLFEISTTEGWVDVMYAAADAKPFYIEPERDYEQWIAATLFCLYIFCTFMFLVNLSVGLIVDNFIRLKQELGGGALMLTEAQQKWVNSRKALYSRKQLFNLSNLHLLPKMRRWVYDVVSSKAFENSIMLMIVFNVICLAMRVFPSQMQGWPQDLRSHWNEVLEVCNIVTGSIFVVEFLIKLYALRMHYWKDAMNVFDFLCIIVAVVGMCLGNPMIGSAMRIARCVKLLAFFKELQRLFRALLLSLPKFANVMVTFFLLLTMYGILGVGLFAPAKHSEDFEANGNFRHFGWALLTLFRSSTGEAWNEIMHDLAKKEQDHYRDGEWCTPNDFYLNGDAHTWSVLESKCLISKPNSCPPYPWLPTWMMPVLFWVSFTVIVTFLFMNLLLAVIIDSYQDCKHHPEAEVIDLCIERWKLHDPDHRAALPLPKVMVFIHEVVSQTLGKKLDVPAQIMSESCFSAMPMRYAHAFTLKVMPDGTVNHISAFQQVFRFTSLEGNLELLEEIDAADVALGSKEATRLKQLESKHPHGCKSSVELRAQIAAHKLQRYFRSKKQQRGKRRASTLPTTLGTEPVAVVPAAGRMASEPQMRVRPEGSPLAQRSDGFGMRTRASTQPPPFSSTAPSGWLRTHRGPTPLQAAASTPVTPKGSAGGSRAEDLPVLGDLEELQLEDVDADGDDDELPASGEQSEPRANGTTQALPARLKLCLVEMDEEEV